MVCTGTTAASKKGASRRSSVKSLRVLRRVCAGTVLLGGRGNLAQQWPQVHLLRIGFGGEALAPFAQQPLPNN